MSLPSAGVVHFWVVQVCPQRGGVEGKQGEKRQQGEQRKHGSSESQIHILARRESYIQVDQAHGARCPGGTSCAEKEIPLQAAAEERAASVDGRMADVVIAASAVTKGAGSADQAADVSEHAAKYAAAAAPM